MFIITLWNGEKLNFENPIKISEVAKKVYGKLPQDLIAGKFNGQARDLSDVITTEGTLSFILSTDVEGLEIIRHSTSHLMAQAVKQLFPEALVTIGPVIENGFYYDFAYDRSFTPQDLEAIEQKMYELAEGKIPVERKVVSRQEAIDFFLGKNEKYKVDIIRELPEGEEIALYHQGDFTDLCRGPHVPHTGYLKAFKLMKIAGAYWRGDSQNEMLQRIYGVAFSTIEDLESYLHQLAEAEKRDHRKIGNVMNIFFTQDVAPGMIFWLDNGYRLVHTIEEYIRRLLRENGYQEVKTPQILERSLWEKSGHWEKYKDLMFVTESEDREFAIKPMNCPGHVQIFKHGLKSYRDLPLRLAEFGYCHRNEYSGTLHGLMRIRGFVQDDAHIFCTEEQIQSEVIQLTQLAFKVYKDFGFQEVEVRLATRPEKRIGEDHIWDHAEKALAQALEEQHIEFKYSPGEGAFYGPKIEFHLKDCLDRSWQCGTIQLDFSMPGRLGAEYVAEDGSRKIPVMIHRVFLGSFERFIGVLIEHYAGVLPVWLSPIQVVVMNITDRQADYVEKIVAVLKEHSLFAISDLRNEKIGLKIREHTLKHVPYLLIVGDREVSDQKVSVRTRHGEDLGSMHLEDFLKRIESEIAEYR